MTRKIFCITHKDYPNLPENTIFIGNGNDFKESFIRTNLYYPEMSDMNVAWGELEGIYYIWKNIDADIKGQYHYRRRFTFSFDDCENILQDNIFIIPKTNAGDKGIRSQYADCHNVNDLDLCGDIVKELYSDSYAKKWDDVMLSTNLYYGNSFIAKNDDYDKACEFVFSVLFKFLEIKQWKNMGDVFNAYNSLEFRNVQYQCRSLGFMGERLFSFYVIANDLENKVYTPEYKII